MEWSMDDALQLIEQYRVHPELWNRAYPKYKDKLCRFRAWSNIAEAFGCSKAEVERKMNVLLTQYRREKHKLLMKLYEGITPGPSKWYAFKRFEFLEGGGGADASLSMGVSRRKSRDMKYFNTMGLGLPLLIANSQSLTGWNGGGPFSPPNDRKNLCPIPIGFPNVQNTSDLLNSRNNPFNHTQTQKNENTTETIEIDEKDDDERQTTPAATASRDTTSAASVGGGGGGAGNFSAQQDNDEELEIKQEMSDFAHHPPLGRSDSHRSYNSSPDDNRTENDDFAQDLRVSAAAQGIDFSRYTLARGLLQQSERYDTNCSPPPPPLPTMSSRKQQTNQMHSNAQQQSGMTTSGNGNEQDDCDYVGSNVSIKLRSMERTQRIIAEKLISEVLFYGQIAELEKTAKIQPK
ncbi:uncharacterized protein LOC129950269 [Eupeodes corollae]|uniref:uncharacterized protein LOC129950269 n=1 Tax=Eupeodes corollae TaxID=290404 RepID=UPI002490ABA9|nr:uncharacterized protein LOC129950269 [Eupeodes corollae]